MVKIGYKVLLAADVWTYTPRTLTSHKFPFTNPDSAVDLANVLMALSGTPATGRVAKLDNLDLKVSSVWEKLMTDLKIDVFTNSFIAKEGADITPSVIASVAGDSYDNNIQALVLKKGGTAGFLAVQMKDLGALYSKLSIFADLRVHMQIILYLSTDGTLNNRYSLFIYPGGSTADIKIQKTVGGTPTNLATLAEDISDFQRIRVRFDLDLDKNFISGSVFNVKDGEWRGIHVYDTAFSSVRYFGVTTWPANTTNIIFYPIIILYE